MATKFSQAPAVATGSAAAPIHSAARHSRSWRSGRASQPNRPAIVPSRNSAMICGTASTAIVPRMLR